MQRKYFLFLFLFAFISCKNTDKSKSNLKDSVNVIGIERTTDKEKRDTAAGKSTIEDIALPPIDTNGNAAKAAKMKKTKIEIKIFQNKEISGFGYDIILDGHIYVHQPNIPALPGNNGFSSEENARKVAGLVSYKIRNNIMPPTVEVKELDSLGIH